MRSLLVAIAGMLGLERRELQLGGQKYCLPPFLYLHPLRVTIFLKCYSASRILPSNQDLFDVARDILIHHGHLWFVKTWSTRKRQIKARQEYRKVEFERGFGGFTVTQLDRSYRGVDGVTKPGRLLARPDRLSLRGVRRR